LFAVTVLTTLWVGASYNGEHFRDLPEPGLLDVLEAGVPYSLTLMTILLCHEMGHFISGRIHRVKLSLPYFIPLPFALGTMGAIIAMPPLESRKKLLDVGAAGPLAGLVVSTAAMVVGLSLSPVSDLTSLPEGTVLFQEGQSLYYILLKRIVLGPIPEGHDVMLHPVAWAAWIGFLVTMLNLLPVGQLDGGHVAYALLGERQNVVSARLHLALVGLGIAVSAYYGVTALVSGASGAEVWTEAQTGLSWFVWAFVLWIIRRLGKGYHPPAPDPTPLGRTRFAVGVFCLVVFVMLFMPVPLHVVQT
jgi:membrane-associated protease RseP (regulator of RpoE activity)